jgi:hypothetical protein
MLWLCGMNVNWNPHSFEDAARVLETMPEYVREAVVVAIRQFGPLSCPAPTWNVAGRYRVALDEYEVPRIELADESGTWLPAPLAAA